MIPNKYTGVYLEGKKCRPVRAIKNRGGDEVSPDTVCTIHRVVRGQGITIVTDKCPHCGQSSWITGVSREDLELIPEESDKGKTLPIERNPDVFCIKASVVTATSDGEPVPGTERIIGIVFNQKVISEEAVNQLISSGMAVFDSRVIVEDWARLCNVLGFDPEE